MVGLGRQLMAGVCAWLGAAVAQAGDFERWKAELAGDYRAFYDAESLGYTALALVPAGLLANSDADSKAREAYQEDWRSELSDDIADTLRSTGEITVMLPLTLAVAEVAAQRNPAESNEGLGGWGRKTFRGLATGIPLIYALQKGLGGARPVQGDSDWQPLEHSASASGHTFVGAVAAFAASDQCDTTWARWTWNTLSVVPGLTRINDDRHYLSQVILGWWVAYQVDDAVRLVPQGGAVASSGSLWPWANERGGGVGLRVAW